MSSAAQLHKEAMSHYDAALAARRTGDEANFKKHIANALRLETAAANEFRHSRDVEPTRSILYRSAATIAMTACAFDQALELAASGLSATPPVQIRSELVSLIKEANYRLNVFESDNVSIGEESITLSLEGEAIGNGMVRQDVFKTKINALINMINRTADRVKGIKFGEARAREATAPIYISPPIPGSFAVEVRLGDQRQPDITGIPQATDADAILNEVVDCFSGFKDGELESLRLRIRDGDYFTNFVALGRQLLPDGTKITAVELVGRLHKGVKRVRVTTPKPKDVRSRLGIEEGIGNLSVISGILRVAEKRAEGKEQVSIIDDSGAWHKVHVPAALMADVVRPLWDSRVTIFAKRGKRKMLELESIEPENQP